MDRRSRSWRETLSEARAVRCCVCVRARARQLVRARALYDEALQLQPLEISALANRGAALLWLKEPYSCKQDCDLALTELDREEVRRKGDADVLVGMFPAQEMTAEQAEGIEALKAKAKAAGLWNLFLPDRDEYGDGPGLSNLDYAPLAEEMGTVPWCSVVFNCAAPDTGNIELLHKYADAAQKARWLGPLLRGEIRSAFCMTEPAVASSDATNMALRVTRLREGGYVLDGLKWWASGVLDPRCELLIVMGRRDDADVCAPHERHSMLLVPRTTPGTPRSCTRLLPS